MSKIFELKGITKKYKNGSTQTTAVDDVSYSLDEGESLAIEGPSGSGKSTLLHILGALDKPTKGTVIISGKDITNFNDAKLSKFRNQTIGFVFQFFNLQDYLNVEENIMIPLLLNGSKPKIALKRAKELLESVGLSHRLGYFPKQLSGGEMQRVAIARSLANNPKILLADEPTANLDKESAKKFVKSISKKS